MGDVMFDAECHFGDKVSPERGLLVEFDIKPLHYCLVTIHRAENTDDPRKLSAIVNALMSYSSEMPVIWQVHPRTHAILSQMGKLEALAGRVLFISTVGSLDMVLFENILL
jgi:UDP-GlcNAc3NAcA epimerase